MDNFVCKCGKAYTKKYNLTRHQQTSCYKNKDKVTYECKYCGRCFTRKHVLASHMLRCQLKDNHILQKNLDLKENEIDNLKKSIKKLNLKLSSRNDNIENLRQIIEEKDEEIMALKIKCETNKTEIYHEVCDKVLDKSTVTNTTTYIHPKLANLPITNIHPLTEDYVKKRVANGEYSFDHYRKGEDGIVDFINSITMCENDDGIVERNYVSTDTSRDSFHRLVETKEWEKDKGGKFIDVILDTLENRVNNYQLRLIDEKIKFKDTRCPHGYDPQTVLENNHDLNTGVVKSHGKERRTLRKRIKKDTSNKVAV
uniref:C2H2-type domain-containing protein n=1 Tax=Marseillevirus LCMAC101 TaxID=2506602 RepID=A0A481YT58_9VIRU|nr:MAG: hypothetical protein LCMAC101_02790 [Marseillevirus LCMAC101]